MAALAAASILPVPGRRPVCAQAPSAGARHTCEKESRRRKRDIKTYVCVRAR